MKATPQTDKDRVNQWMGRMSIRPVHTWWLGVALFAPSVLAWLFATLFCIYKDMFHCPFDWNGIMRVYLPMFAAVVAFTVPLVCLRKLRACSWHITAWAFAGYLAVILTWGIIDIRCGHYQLGGHDYLTGDYFHTYYTWPFLPYKWIE